MPPHAQKNTGQKRRRALSVAAAPTRGACSSRPQRAASTRASQGRAEATTGLLFGPQLELLPPHQILTSLFSTKLGTRIAASLAAQAQLTQQGSAQAGGVAAASASAPHQRQQTTPLDLAVAARLAPIARKSPWLRDAVGSGSRAPSQRRLTLSIARQPIFSGARLFCVGSAANEFAFARGLAAAGGHRGAAAQPDDLRLPAACTPAVHAIAIESIRRGTSDALELLVLGRYPRFGVGAGCGAPEEATGLLLRAVFPSCG